MTTLFTISGAREADPAIQRWLEDQRDDLKAIAIEWFTYMRHLGPDVREAMHDGYATVCVNDAPFAYVGAFKAHVNVGFFHGAELPDPAALLTGTGKSMRHVTLRPHHPVNGQALQGLISSAYRDIRERSHS